ncbi:MAG: hypothetical protein CMM44_11195 [Rhodospirillaceae bacterium]|nr:hypothetical protein [Rhodospirillaceae bacterium]
MLFLMRTYLQSILLYAGVGGIAAIIEWGIFYLIFVYAEIPYFFAALPGFFVATLSNWFLCRTVAFFPNSEGSPYDLVQIFVASSIAMIVNLITMTALIESGLTDIFSAKIVGTGVAFSFNYVIRQFIIYSKKPVTFDVAQNRILGMMPVKISLNCKHAIEWVKRIFT